MNVQHDLTLFRIPVFSEGGESVFIYSKDESCKKWLIEKLHILMDSYSVVFRAKGLEDNLMEVISKINGEKTNYFPGDAKKIFIRRYPEYFCIINNDIMIDTILDEWVSTIYEYRALYIVPPENSDTLISILRKNVYSYSDKNVLQVIMKNIDGYIENVQDAPDHDSYIINLKNKIWNKIGGAI